MTEKIAVAALNAQDFAAWCQENGISQRDKRLIFLGSPNKLRGHSGPVTLHVTRRAIGRRDMAEIRAHVDFINATAPPENTG